MVNDLQIVFILWMGLKSAESPVLKGWSLHRQFGQMLDVNNLCESLSGHPMVI
jgi:hypothetical protein